jgi:hypothetical protein
MLHQLVCLDAWCSALSNQFGLMLVAVRILFSQNMCHSVQLWRRRSSCLVQIVAYRCERSLSTKRLARMGQREAIKRLV